MKKTMILIILVAMLVFTESVFAADIEGNALNRPSSEKVVMTINKTGTTSEKEGGLFKKLEGTKATLLITTSVDYSHITDVLLEYFDDGRLIRKNFNMAGNTIVLNNDCNCELYQAEIPEGEVNDRMTIKLTIHRCSGFIKMPYQALVSAGNSWCGKEDSIMEMSGSIP